MLSGLHAPSGPAASYQGLQMLLERTQAQVSHRCRKAWKETAKRTRAFHRFPQGPENCGSSWERMTQPWSPPAFTKTQRRIRAVTGEISVLILRNTSRALSTCSPVAGVDSGAGHTGGQGVGESRGWYLVRLAC